MLGQKGFSAVFILLTVVFLLLIIGPGWYIYSHKPFLTNKNTTELTASPSPSPSPSSPASYLTKDQALNLISTTLARTPADYELMSSVPIEKNITKQSPVNTKNHLLEFQGVSFYAPWADFQDQTLSASEGNYSFKNKETIRIRYNNFQKLFLTDDINLPYPTFNEKYKKTGLNWPTVEVWEQAAKTTPDMVKASNDVKEINKLIILLFIKKIYYYNPLQVSWILDKKKVPFTIYHRGDADFATEGNNVGANIFTQDSQKNFYDIVILENPMDANVVQSIITTLDLK